MGNRLYDCIKRIWLKKKEKDKDNYKIKNRRLKSIKNTLSLCLFFKTIIINSSLQC